MEGTFYLGCIVGAVIITIVGFILNQIQNERKKVNAHKKKQAVVLLTSKTPEQIIHEHREAMFNIFLWILLGIFLILLPLVFINLV